MSCSRLRSGNQQMVGGYLLSQSCLQVVRRHMYTAQAANVVKQTPEPSVPDFTVHTGRVDLARWLQGFKHAGCASRRTYSVTIHSSV
jgi:hypothetical protein